jgi:CubicO group peptidase (beta-lactamase class C family)/beta-glucosidase-like glycosyl hydrolase
MLKGVFFSLLTLLLHLVVSPTNGLNVLEIRELEKKNEHQKTEYVSRLDYLRLQQRWIDSLMSQMTSAQKIGQLFIASTSSGYSESEIETLVREKHIGGVAFSKGKPSQKVLQINQYQKLSVIPLLIGINSEFGLADALDSVISFPNILTIKAIQNEALIRQTGYEVGRQCKRLGIHFNLGITDTIANQPFITAFAKGMSEKNVIHFTKIFEGKRTSLIGISIENNVFKKGTAQNYTENDIFKVFESQDLIITDQIEKHIAQIKKAVENGDISQEDLDKKLERVLRAKFATGLFAPHLIATDNLIKELNTPEAKAINEKLYEQAITLVKNKQNLIPFTQLDSLTFASIAIGESENNEFQRILSKYAPFENYSISEKNSFNNPHLFNTLCEKVQNKSVVIIGLHNIVSENAKQFIENLKEKTKVVLVIFGEPSLLADYQDIDHLVCAYQDNKQTQGLLPQFLFGAVSNNAKLPMSVANLPQGIGVSTQSLQRLRYSDVPESVGVDSEILVKIDTIIHKAIEKEATPGCQIIVARRGTVIFNKNYGHLTYNEKKAIPVTDNTIYDLASLTKVVATMQAIMHLYELGKIDIDKKAVDYLPDLKGTNKENITLKKMLIHQAGLIQDEPFWWKAMEKKEFRQAYIRTSKSDSFNVQITENAFARSSIKDSIWNWTKNLKLRNKKNGNGDYGYLYSDIGFYILKRIAEKYLQEPLNEYLDKNLYKPLGMSVMGYLPLQKYPRERIAPTEEDKHFRKGTVQGFVHDPDAALAGGIAGHAGVFSNANDVAILAQMHLQNGFYGGRRYYKEGTVPFFTAKRQLENNRRGLGWDKPIKGFGGPSSGYCSTETYGHTGFTGTSFWIDPKYDLIFIFLTNKSYPFAHNRKLNNENVRNQIHNLVYQALDVQDRFVSLEKQKQKD